MLKIFWRAHGKPLKALENYTSEENSPKEKKTQRNLDEKGAWMFDGLCERWPGLTTVVSKIKIYFPYDDWE